MTPLPRPVAFQLKVVVGYTTGGEMLLYDVVDFEPTSLTMKKDGTSLTSQLNDSAADSTSVPSTTSISDPVGVVKKKTDAWISLNRLQLPVGENQYGSIRSIAYADG